MKKKTMTKQKINANMCSPQTKLQKYKLPQKNMEKKECMSSLNNIKKEKEKKKLKHEGGNHEEKAFMQIITLECHLQS
jgi:hypothetical protein